MNELFAAGIDHEPNETERKIKLSGKIVLNESIIGHRLIVANRDDRVAGRCPKAPGAFLVKGPSGRCQAQQRRPTRAIHLRRLSALASRRPTSAAGAAFFQRAPIIREAAQSNRPPRALLFLLPCPCQVNHRLASNKRVIVLSKKKSLPTLASTRSRT